MSKVSDQMLQHEPSPPRFPVDSVLSEGVLLAVVPFVGSVLALLYEAGYLSFYGVPVSVVQLDFVRIVTATAIVIFFAVLYAIVFMLAAALVQGGGPFRRALAPAVAFALLLGPVFLLTPGPPERWWILLALAVLSVVDILVWPLLERKKDARYTEKLSASLAADRNLRRDAQIELQAQRPFVHFLNERVILPAALIFFSSFAVFAIGKNAAARNEVHWVTKEQPPWLLVTSYGSTLVLKSYDPSTRAVGAELRLVNATETSAPTLMRLRTGILHEFPPLK